MAEKTFALINVNVDVAKLSKPATKVVGLLRSIFEAVYEPTGIRRKAKAEAAASITAALAHERVQEIELRSVERLLSFEIRRQENIEEIARKAIDVADDVAKSLPPPEREEEADAKVDEDWVYSFFGYCQDVKNEQMQILWAKLLAGEVVRPGSYSLQTLGIVKILRQQDAEQFTRLCSFVWQSSSDLLAIINTKEDRDLLAGAGLDFSTLLHLESLGLIRYESLGGSRVTNETGKFGFAYHGRIYFLSLAPEAKEKEVRLGNVLLTPVGKELVPLADPSPNEEYRERVLERWREKGIEIVEHSPNSVPSESQEQTDP